MSKSSLSICWQVPCGMPKLPVISELILHWSSSTIFKNSPYFHLYHLWGYDMFLCSPQCFRVFWVNHSNICIPMTLPLKAVMSISCFSYAVFLRLMQNLIQIHCFFTSTIRKLWGACNMLKNTHPLRKNAEGYGCNSHHTDSSDSDIKEYSGRRLYYLAFLVIKMSSETSGYALICMSI